MKNTLPDAADDDLKFLLYRSVAFILKTEDPTAFLRWFEESAQSIAPVFFRQFGGHPEVMRSFSAFFSRYIWNRTALPGNHFRPRPLPKPERNAPCLCGSGRKYKQCCLPMAPDEATFPNLSLLRIVLDNLTAKERAALPYEYLSPDELAHVADEWMQEGRADEAAKLLEGLFADMTKVDHRAEAAFDCLLNCYDELGNPLKKKRLLERGSEAPNKRIRAAAMQRRCCILADRNEYAEAWTLFQQLQRLDPEDPSLSHLEVTILLSQGEATKAAERAKFWLARLARNRSDDYGDLMDFLREIAQGDAASAKKSIATKSDPLLQRLTALVEQLPAPECHYSLRRMDDSAGPLLPDNKLQSLYAQWETQGEYSQAIDDDLEWLEQHPLAWQSFEIMVEWVETLMDTRVSRGFEEVVALPILRHAEALLRLILQRYQAEGLKFEWGWHENRPALSLLLHLVSVLRLHKRFGEAVQVAEWMVQTLNPNDNQGMRDDLIHDYLRTGRITDAIALSERYPGDMGAMRYGRALALFMAGREADAQAAANDAKSHFPEIRKMLLADKPKQPPLRDGLVSVGGKDEAWYYRQDHLEIWQSSGGLEWLGQLSGKANQTGHLRN